MNNIYLLSSLILEAGVEREWDQAAKLAENLITYWIKQQDIHS